jgi:hypothetical protein
LIKAATTQAQADTVSLYSLSSVAWQTYYFSTLKGCWLSPSGANANNTIIYPYAALKVTRLANDTDTSLVLTGRVTEVPLLTKTTGSSAVVYGSTHFATNMTLSQIQLGANWTKSTSASTADTLAVWDATLLQFDSYYQSSTDSTWHSTTNTTANQSSLVIPAGTAISIVQRQTVSGAKSFLASTMPYSLN